MPVAKTYANMQLSGEPFKENGRMYVNVIAPKGIKKVRWYSDTEYRRMYPNNIVEHSTTNFNAYHAFGFDAKGYILIYKGKNVEEWAENDRTNIWYNLIFGYYTPSKFECPKLADGIEAIQLKWEDIIDHDKKMLPYEKVKKIVAAMLNDGNESQFQGAINEWLQKTVTIREKKSKDSHFGTKHTYTLEDSENNTYIWETGAKDYPVAQTVSLKMKVKEHKEISNEKVTVVWYCKEC
jgi:hypothetical protein